MVVTKRVSKNVIRRRTVSKTPNAQEINKPSAKQLRRLKRKLERGRV